MVHPDALKMTSLKYEEEIDEAEAKQVAEALFEDDRYFEALLLYIRLKDTKAIVSVRTKAIDMGDFLLYQTCCQELGEDIDESILQGLATTAQRLGKTSYVNQINAILHPPTDEDEPEQ